MRRAGAAARCSPGCWSRTARWRLTTIGADFLPAVRRGQRPGQRHPAGRVVARSVERGRGAWSTRSSAAVADSRRRTRTARSSRSSAGPAGRSWTSTPSRRTVGRVHPHHQPGLREDAGRGDRRLSRRRSSEEVPGVDVEVEQPLAHLISHMISGGTAQIAIKVYGDDLDTLETARQRDQGGDRAACPGVELARHRADPAGGRAAHPAAARRARLLRAWAGHYVGEFVQTALQGEVVSQVVEGQRRFDLVVRLEEPYRTDVAQPRPTCGSTCPTAAGRCGSSRSGRHHPADRRRRRARTR